MERDDYIFCPVCIMLNIPLSESGPKYIESSGLLDVMAVVNDNELCYLFFNVQVN